MSEYPYTDGPTTVLGPEIFASEDGSVICWRGRNYVPQAEKDETTEDADSPFSVPTPGERY